MGLAPAPAESVGWSVRRVRSDKGIATTVFRDTSHRSQRKDDLRCQHACPRQFVNPETKSFGLALDA